MKRSNDRVWFGACALSGALGGCGLEDPAAEFRFGTPKQEVPIEWIDSDDSGDPAPKVTCSGVDFDMGGGCEDSGSGDATSGDDATGSSAGGTSGSSTSGSSTSGSITIGPGTTGASWGWETTTIGVSEGGGDGPGSSGTTGGDGSSTGSGGSTGGDGSSTGEEGSTSDADSSTSGGSYTASGDDSGSGDESSSSTGGTTGDECQLSAPPVAAMPGTPVLEVVASKCSAIGQVMEAHGDLLEADGPTPPQGFAGWREELRRHGEFFDILVPFSRAPEYTDLENPRVVATTRKNTVAGLQLTGKLYLGCVFKDTCGQIEDGRVEFISWNEKDARFDFGIIEDPGNATAEDVKLVDRAACTKCHLNEGPIFQRRGWSGTEAEGGVIAAFVYARAKREGEDGGPWSDMFASLAVDPAPIDLCSEAQQAPFKDYAWNGVKLFRGSCSGGGQRNQPAHDAFTFEEVANDATLLLARHKHFAGLSPAKRKELLQRRLATWVHGDILGDLFGDAARAQLGQFFTDNPAPSQRNARLRDANPLAGVKPYPHPGPGTYPFTKMAALDSVLEFNKDRRAAKTNQYNFPATNKLPAAAADDFFGLGKLSAGGGGFDDPIQELGDADAAFVKAKLNALIASFDSDPLRVMAAYAGPVAFWDVALQAALAEGLLNTANVKQLTGLQTYPTRDQLMTALVRGIEELQATWQHAKGLPVLAPEAFRSPYSGCSLTLEVKAEPKGACGRCHVGPDATLKGNLNATFDLGSLEAWTARLDPEGTASDAERREAQTWLLGQGVARPANLGVAGRKSPRASSLEKLCTGDMPPPDSPEEKALTPAARAALIAGLKQACADLIGEDKCKQEFADCYPNNVSAEPCDLDEASCSLAEFCGECSAEDPACGLCQSCGDGECDAGAGEDELTCGADCGPFAGACMGACGSYVEAADCWCDAACEESGDCCLGVFSDCPA